jgi:hypothetical protein
MTILRAAFVLLLAARFLVPPAGAAEVEWIGIGGGADPATSQVSLEQDLRLARAVFGADGVVLFAGGADAYGVQVLRPNETGDPLRAELGELLDPRDGREATYRKPEPGVDGPATPQRIEAEIARALADGNDPLLLYIAMHGERGESPADNTVVLWGDFTLSARRVAELLEATPSQRQVRFVNTACYSGGFAELAFVAADAEKGGATNRCGLFAATADDVSSGCDPNPDRRAQDAYGLHFLHALRGEARDGTPLPRAQIDFDGDGKVSLLEAHTRVRIASRSFDMPTTTSERWLRHAVPDPVAPAADTGPVDGLPEERAVIAALGRELDAAGPAASEARRAAAEEALAKAEEAMNRAGEGLDHAAADLRIALLERWPVLDDPWHPEFAVQFAGNREAIAALLHDSEPGRRYAQLLDEHHTLGLAFDAAKVHAARTRVLARAWDTVVLAARLRQQGGEGWRQFLALVDCERGTLR